MEPITSGATLSPEHPCYLLHETQHDNAVGHCRAIRLLDAHTALEIVPGLRGRPEAHVHLLRDLKYSAACRLMHRCAGRASLTHDSFFDFVAGSDNYNHQNGSVLHRSLAAEVENVKQDLVHHGTSSDDGYWDCQLCPWRAFGTKRQLVSHQEYHKDPYYTAATAANKNGQCASWSREEPRRTAAV